MIEQGQSSEHEIVNITSALISALGMKPPADGQKVQSATIFLSKLFRKYSTQTSKKFHEVKLNRLNGMLYKVCKQPPSRKSDIQIIYQIILSFLYNEGGALIDDNSFATNTCIWISKFVQQILSVKQSTICIQFIETLLKIKKPTLISPQTFQKNIQQSTYFKDKQIIKNDQLSANQKITYRGFMSEFSVYQQIKQCLKLATLFQNLYNNSQQKTNILKLFISYCRQTDVQNMKELFVKVFITKNAQSKQILQAIIGCLDTEFFSADDFTQIVRMLISINDRKLFYRLSLKNIKCQNKFMDILVQNIKTNMVDQLADAFINQKQINNYYLLYLINKSHQQLSDRHLLIPLGKLVTNRHAIICALCVNQNGQAAHSKILNMFFDNESSLTSKQKLDILKIAHFSYISVPKSHLLTHIIKSISYNMLDQQSNFQFLPRDNYQKISLDKNQRQQINDFLKRYFGNSDQVYWIKLDLYSICGKPVAYLQDFKKIQKMFQAPIDQIVTQLPNLPENLLQVALMGTNNKLFDQFLVNQNTAGPVIQWALDSYKKQYKKFRTNVEAYLKRNNNLQYLELILQIFDFNLDQKIGIYFDEQFKSITSLENVPKLNGLNFSQYFMSPQGDPNQLIYNVNKSKNFVIQFQKLIRLLSNEGKTQNRKQLKTLVSQQSAPLRALKIIKLLSQTPYQKNKGEQKFKKLTQILLEYIKPQFEYFKQLSARSNQVNIQYIPIYESLQFLLSVSYQKTINFISKLIRSSPVKIQQKLQRNKKCKRKGNNNADQNADKSGQILIENIEFCFKGDPNSLSSYQSIIAIIEQIKNWPNNQQLKNELVQWLAKIKIFHKQQYKLWRQKVTNYIQLWQCVSPIVSNIISNDKIQKHFLIMIDLLNKLYQKFKQQKDFLHMQKKLLNGIYILYIMALNKEQKNKMEEQNFNQNQIIIPKQRLNEVIVNIQLPQMSVPHIYFCFDCSKKVCNDCAAIIHKNHDKNYVGIGNQTQCHRFLNKSKEGNQRRNIKQRYNQKLFKQANLDLVQKQRQLERIIMLTSQNTDKLPPEIIMRMKSMKDRQAQYLLFRKNQRINMINESQEAEQQEKRKQNNADQLLQKFQIKSCSQKQFTFNNANLFLRVQKPKPTFQTLNIIKKQKTQCLNIVPLLNLLVRQLKSNSFFTSLDIQLDQKNTLSQFQAQLSNQKYIMLKLQQQYKNNNIPRMGNPYLSGQQSYASNTFGAGKRNLFAINDLVLAILIGNQPNQINYIETKTYRSKFIKKQSEKRYRQNDNLQGYRSILSKISQPSLLISEISFSPSTNDLLAEISSNKIIFQKIGQQGKNRLLKTQRINSSEIIKFQWVRSSRLKNVFIYLTHQLVVSKIGKREHQEKLTIPLSCGKVRDFSTVCLNSKIITITLLNSQGKIYRANLDVSTKKIPIFNDHKVNFNNNNDMIASITCQGSSIFCTTVSGKIIILNVNEDNNLTSLPLIFPIIQSMKSHKISQINSKFKQASKIGKLRVISQNQNQIYISCLLMKENNQDGKKLGYFVIISLNIQNKKSKVLLYNDQGTTDSYDFINLNQKQFMFVCLQDDGELWSCKLNTQSKTSLLKPSDFVLVPTQTMKYANSLSKTKVLSEIQFYSSDRKHSFKQHTRITDHFKIAKTDTLIKFQQTQKQLLHWFITGVELSCILSQESQGHPSPIAFTFLGNSYRFSLTKARQIQLPLTIKQVLDIYLGEKQFKIQFSQGNAIANIKDIIIHGVKVTEKSVYLQAFSNLCELFFIYKGFNDLNGQKKIERYLLNQFQTDFRNIENKAIEDYFIKKKFTLSEQNLLFKLELLRESIQNYKTDKDMVIQCFEGIRNYILPNCNQRRQLMTSAYKLCKALTQSVKSPIVFKLGHPLNYQTQIDIYTVFRVYRIFRAEPTIDNYQDLLVIICRILNSRTLNAFILLAVYSQILRFVCGFFKKIMLDYKLYFKVNDYGLQKQEKVKLNRICSQMMRITIQFYQLKKNKSENGTKNCQQQLLKVMQFIFCLSKKQIHRQIKLNPFQFLSSVFEDGTYTLANPAINYLQLQKVQIQQPKKPIQQSLLISQPKIQPSSNPLTNPTNQAQNINSVIQNNLDQMQERAALQMQNQGLQQNQQVYEQSCEEHKQPQEQHREMLDQFAYQLQPEAGTRNLGFIQKLQEQDQDVENDKVQLKNSEELWKNLDINTKKIYDYLGKATEGMIPQQMQFKYFQICESLLLQIFANNPNNSSTHKYLNADNLVLYVGLVYNLLYIIQKKLNTMFKGSQFIDPSHPYIQNNMFSIIESIDNKIDHPAYSVLYLPINSIITYNLKKEKQRSGSSMFVQILMHYYKQNIDKSKLLECLKSSNWHPQTYKQPASLTSVLRFEYFDLINPIYQLKYVGNLYLNLRNQKLAILQNNRDKIKQNILKVVVKYNLKVYFNIMILQNWSESLQKTKITVAFEQLSIKPLQSLRTILKSITKDLKIFVEIVNQDLQKIPILEELLSGNNQVNQVVLEILNAYYSYQAKN